MLETLMEVTGNKVQHLLLNPSPPYLHEYQDAAVPNPKKSCHTSTLSSDQVIVTIYHDCDCGF